MLTHMSDMSVSDKMQMQQRQQLRQSLPSMRSVPSERKVSRRRRSKTKEALALVSDDPPDHMEERARRIQNNIVSRQRSGSSLSASSSMSAPTHAYSHKQHSQYKQFQNMNEKNRLGSSKSISPCDSTPIQTAKTSPLSSSCHVLLPTTKETSSETTDNDEHTFHPRSRNRQQSPHPADILKGQTARSSGVMNDSMSKKQTVAPQSSSPPSNGETPIFTISNNLESSESAEELRRLIEAMQNEFQRLRSSKIHAEAQAEKLQTDLKIQQQEMEKHFESLSMENQRLKNDANETKIKMGRIMGKVNQLESENRMLKGECTEMQMTKEVAEAKAVAAERRATAAEEECAAMQNTMKVMMAKTAHGGGRSRRSFTSPLKRSKESTFSKPAKI